jgi:hypothetical protein
MFMMYLLTTFCLLVVTVKSKANGIFPQAVAMCHLRTAGNCCNVKEMLEGRRRGVRIGHQENGGI